MIIRFLFNNIISEWDFLSMSVHWKCALLDAYLLSGYECFIGSSVGMLYIFGVSIESVYGMEYTQVEEKKSVERYLCDVFVFWFFVSGQQQQRRRKKNVGIAWKSICALRMALIDTLYTWNAVRMWFEWIYFNKKLSTVIYTNFFSLCWSVFILGCVCECVWCFLWF